MPEPHQVGLQRRLNLLARHGAAGAFHHHPLTRRQRPPDQPMGAGQRRELRHLQHQPPAGQRAGADRQPGIRAGACEDVAQPQGRILDDGQRPRRRQLLRRGHGAAEQDEHGHERAHDGGPQRMRESVDSISSLAVMTLLFIS